MEKSVSSFIPLVLLKEMKANVMTLQREPTAVHVQSVHRV